MARDMAKAMCQHYMDTKLIEDATDSSSAFFKDRSFYVLTPKGLHVVEQFIGENNISTEKLQHVFATQPVCTKLLHLERRSSDDEIVISQSVVATLFRRFVGRQPNYLAGNSNLDSHQKYNERAKGVVLQDIAERSAGGIQQRHECCFSAVTALEWLCDFTSIVGREEAAEMAAQFVRFGLITLVSDKRKNDDSVTTFIAPRGSASDSPLIVSGVFLLLYLFPI